MTSEAIPQYALQVRCLHHASAAAPMDHAERFLMHF